MIKPNTQDRQCVYIDLYVDDTGAPTSPGLLGTPIAFVSHWWGYRIRDLVAMIRAHDDARVAAGAARGAYFFDMFVLNQHQLTKNCTTDLEKREQLIQGLRRSLLACGTLLLCCTAGPEGVGWEQPAPLGRVWCLFEVFVAVTEGVAVVVRLESKDMVDFQHALNMDGMARVSRALAALDARDASASVSSDKDMVLDDIQTTVGFDEFNRQVREGMLAEYKRISVSAMR